MNQNIEKLINETIYNNTLVKINAQLYLKKYQMEILDYYHIDYKKCGSVSEVLLNINEVLETKEVDDYEALEDVAMSLQEFNYYHNTNK